MIATYYIFLDVDGVLNQSSTKERILGRYKGIDPRNLTALKDLMTAATKACGDNIKIILSSSWRYDTDQFGNQSFNNAFRDELTKNLASVNLYIHADTPIIAQHRRGFEIVTYLADTNEPIDGYVVLDDICFTDFTSCHIARHLIQTSNFHGLTEKHEHKAIEILKSGLTEREQAFIELAKQHRQQDR